MNDNRRQILEMLAAGKITADEAERLLAALDPDTGQTRGGNRAPRRKRSAARDNRRTRQIPARAGRGR